MECVGHPLDEFAILAAAICTGKHVSIMLNAMEFWTSREDSDWEKCDIYFAYIGDEVFIPIERLDMSLLNRVAQRVSLGDTSCVRPKRGRKKKIVTPTEETTTGVKELKNGIGKQKAKELKANIIEAESSEPKRRGWKRKNNDETSKQERKDVVKGKTKGLKEKKRYETSTAETLERGHKPPIQENENVVKRKRGRPKKRVITDNIKNDDDDADVFCEQHKPKRKLYNRESKSKGRVFIKALTGKNRNGKKGKKHDLETELNDIDIMIKNMGTAETSIVGVSNVEQCNLQVASTHQTEEGNKEHKELYQRNLEEIEDDIVTDGVVTFGVGGSKENEESTDGAVTDGVGGSKENEEFTDGAVTDGVGGSKENEEFTDGAVTDGVGGSKENEESTDGAVTDGVGGSKENEESTDGAVTDSVGGSKENEESTDGAVTDGVGGSKENEESMDGAVTDGVGGSKENEESTDGAVTDDNRDSTDSTNNTEGTITIDEHFSKVCSTCPSNTESESLSPSSSNKKESVAENSKVEMKEKTEGQKKRRRLRMKIKRKSKNQIDYKEETDGSDQTGSNKKSETCDSETEEEETKRVDIKYATKNKTEKKKMGKGRKDSLVVKTITIAKQKSKKYKCIESACDEIFNDMKEWVKHINNEHKLQEYSCTICGHKTKSKDKYEKHTMAHEEKQNKWKCSVCSKTFTYKCYLQRHELIHTDEKKYECTDPDCQKKEAGKFKHKADFIRHMEKHSGKSFKCKICESVWPSKKDRYEHERSVHRPLKECQNEKCHYFTKDPKMLIKHKMNCKK